MKCSLFALFAIFISLLFPKPIQAQINTDNVILMGRSALSMDDYVTAIHFFNQVIEAKPHLHTPYYYRAYAKFSLEDYVGAEADCTRSLELNPYRSDVYQLRGLCRIHNENFQGAIDDYTRALMEEPDDQGSLYNRALCRLELKDFETADQEIDKILSKWKNFQRAYLIKAQIAMEMKDTLKSLVWVDSLLQVNPRNEQAWSFKGRYALSKNDLPLADSCLTQAIHLNPDHYENYVIRAQVRHGLNRFEQALDDYDQTILLVPEHFIAHYNRGLLRALVGDKNRAIEDFDYIIRVEPDNTLAIYNRALLREETGDYAGAIDDYSILIDTYPNFTYGYMARANCRRKVGNIKGAVADETFVTRAQLDLKYKPHKRRPVKEVRKRSDHSLDQYQQLVEETPDTTRRFVNQLIGKIQNRKVEQSALPFYSLAFRTPDYAKHFNTPVFLPEVDRINRKELIPAPLTFEATNERMRSIGEMESAKNIMDQKQDHSADAHLVCAIIDLALYNYDEALLEVDQAEKLDSLNYLYPLQRATIYFAKHQAKVRPDITETQSEDATSHRPAQGPQPLTLAMAHINHALQLSPNNAYLLYNRGCLYGEMQQYDAALKDYDAALQLDPQMAEVRYNRALIYMKTGELDKAFPDLSRAGQDGLYKAYNLLKQATRMKAEEKKEKDQADTKE